MLALSFSCVHSSLASPRATLIMCEAVHVPFIIFEIPIWKSLSLLCGFFVKPVISPRGFPLILCRISDEIPYKGVDCNTP
jgi:hypothetical protein